MIAELLEELKTVPEGQRRFLRMPVKGPLLKAVTSIPNTDRVPGVFVPQAWPMSVRSLLPQGTTEKSAVAYVRELTFTNSARVVGPGLAKPESTFTYEGKSAVVVTIAHTARLSEQILDDAPAFAAQSENRLLYGLSVAEDRQLLNGTGVAPEMEGLMKVAVATTGVVAPVAVGAMPAAIAKAIGELAAAGVVASGIVLNPADWLGIQTTVVGGVYPFIGPTLWNLPVVVTPAMAVGNFLVGWFGAAQIFDREDAVFRISTEDRDNFIRDLITALAEERLALAIYAPASFRKAG
jgi:HK97 family phage major capsid protein